jgi:cathepsin L
VFDAGEVSWWMTINEDSDLTHEEWSEKRLGGVPSVAPGTKMEDVILPEIMEKIAKQGPAPKEWNWVSAGKVSAVKNQGQCGSCACFSATGAIESCFMISANDNAAGDLSEQHLLDCGFGHVVSDASGSWQAYGCDGAWPNVYMDYVKGAWNHEEFSYPYTSGSSGAVGSCRSDDGGVHSKAYVTGYQNQWGANEANLEALLQYGPVATNVKATSGWQGYGGGVLYDGECCNAASDPSCQYSINHSVLVVGYGNEGGYDYWLIKNSWSSGWGEGGYIKLYKGTGHCGVAYSQQALPTCAVGYP